jgi:PAS domain S-box-containing protein
LRLSTKIILASSLIVLLPVVALSAIVLRGMDVLGGRMIATHQADLRETTERAVREKALDVARELEIALRGRRDLSPDALHGDATLREIAIQRVGSTGYTAVHRRDGVNLFHPDQGLEGTDLLAVASPGARYFAEFHDLFKRSLTAEEPVQGYYRWARGREVVDKFMVVAPVRGTDLLVAATIPTKDFDLSGGRQERGVAAAETEFLLLFLGASGTTLAAAIVLGALLSLSFTRPIARLQKGLAAFTQGDLLYRIPVASHDEMGTLSLMFNQMADELSAKDAQLAQKTKAAEESEKNYRRLVENLHDVASIVDRDGRITFVSPSATEILGYAPEEVVGRTLLELVHPDDVHYVDGHIQDLVRRRERRMKIEYRFRHKNGAYRTVSVRGSMLYGPGGEWLGRVAVTRDVTEERRMEKEIRLLSLAVEQSGDGILVTTLEGNVVFANRAWANLHGYESGDELVDRHQFRFHPEDEALRLQDVLQEVLAAGSWSGEMRHWRPDGSTFLSLFGCTRLRDTAGRNIGYVVIATDITARKRVEDRLRRHSDDLEALVQQRTRELQDRTRDLERAMRQAQDADATKGEFMAQVSHELRTPLNSIIGFSRLLMRATDPPLPENRRFDVELIHQNGQYLLELINGILDLSKIEAGGMDVARESFDLADVVRETIQTVQPLATLARLSLVDRVGGRSVPLYADRGKIRQVLFNLLSNAIKFTQAGEVEVSQEQTPTAITIHVRDTGIGLSPAERERIFEKFVQLAGPQHGRFAGTGIGLTVARSFVELHGGRIWVDSDLGRGSTFHVRLPKVQPEDFVVPSQELA